MIALSPLLASKLRAVEAGIVDQWNDKPKAGIRYRCPDCAKLHQQRSSAVDCCPPEPTEVDVDADGKPLKASEAPHEEQPTYTCPACNKMAADVFDAADCCLWHDIGLAQRYRVAEAVRRGATWADAIAAEAAR